jgi:integrase
MTAKFLENARDLFLIGANTGLRVSDFNRLTEANIFEEDGKQYFNLITQKTSKQVAIPINWMVSEILNNHNGIPPKRMDNQHINYGVKHLGKLAGLDKEETKIYTKGGKKVIRTFKQYQLICNHTARRSFCTNAYLSDMPTVDIMAISGHSTEKVFYSYIKIDHIGKAKKISKHNFFADKRLNIVS